MKHVLAAIALSCLLSVPTLAGDIPTDGLPSPAPNGTTQASSGKNPTPPGDVPTVGVPEQLSSDALSALLSVLSFLAV